MDVVSFAQAGACSCASIEAHTLDIDRPIFTLSLGGGAAAGGGHLPAALKVGLAALAGSISADRAGLVGRQQIWWDLVDPADYVGRQHLRRQFGGEGAAWRAA